MSLAPGDGWLPPVSDAAVAHAGPECVNGTLDRALDSAKKKTATVAVDFGTGPGHALRGLSTRFGAAVGVDISPALVKTANARAAQQGLSGNTVALVSDLSKGASIRPAIVKACKAAEFGTLKVNFGVCANVLLSPSLVTRRAILDTIAQTLEVGGSCLFVVPSLESRLWSEQLLRQWDPAAAPTEGLAGLLAAMQPQPAKKRTKNDGCLTDILNGVLPGAAIFSVFSIKNAGRMCDLLVVDPERSIEAHNFALQRGRRLRSTSCGSSSLPSSGPRNFIQK